METNSNLKQELLETLDLIEESIRKSGALISPLMFRKWIPDIREIVNKTDLIPILSFGYHSLEEVELNRLIYSTIVSDPKTAFQIVFSELVKGIPLRKPKHFNPTTYEDLAKTIVEKLTEKKTVMKIHTHEELEQLATEKPQELAHLFARLVAGEPTAFYPPNEVSLYASSSGRMNEPPWKLLPRYLIDWTAVINSGKQAGIEMSVDVGRHASAWKHRNIVKTFKECFHRQNWPDCAALMIVMIEVVQAQ